MTVAPLLRSICKSSSGDQHFISRPQLGQVLKAAAAVLDPLHQLTTSASLLLSMQGMPTFTWRPRSQQKPPLQLPSQTRRCWLLRT
jgi:hypothetical protein